MRYLILIFIIFVTSCSDIGQPVKAESKDGRFRIVTSVDDNGIIQLSIFEGDDVRKRIDTRASIYSKFAVGWFNEENVLVLNSSDIGTFSWSLADNFEKSADGELYTDYGRVLYDRKYR